MTPQSESEENQRSTQQARQDLQDLRDLRKFAPFERYFMRRLRQKAELIAESYRDDPPFVVERVKQFEGDKQGVPTKIEVCGPEEREILRRLLKEYQTIMGLAGDEEEGNITRTLDRQS